MLHRHSEVFRTLIGLVDLALIAMAWLGAYALRFHAGWPVPLGVPALATYVYPLVLILPLFLVLFRAHGLYQARRMDSALGEAGAVVRATVLGILGLAHLPRLRVDLRLLLGLGRFGQELLLQLRGQDQFEDAEVAGLVVEVDAGVFGGAGSLLVGGEQRVLERIHQLVGGDSLLLLERFDCLDDLLAHWGDSLVSGLVPERPYLGPGEETSSE